jgi:hypothetical protein
MCVCVSDSLHRRVYKCVWVMATEIVVQCWQARATNQEERGHEERDSQQSKL